MLNDTKRLRRPSGCCVNSNVMSNIKNITTQRLHNRSYNEYIAHG